jgi:hypothetical protein
LTLDDYRLTRLYASRTRFGCGIKGRHGFCNSLRWLNRLRGRGDRRASLNLFHCWLRHLSSLTVER